MFGGWRQLRSLAKSTGCASARQNGRCRLTTAPVHSRCNCCLGSPTMDAMDTALHQFGDLALHGSTEPAEQVELCRLLATQRCLEVRLVGPGANGAPRLLAVHAAREQAAGLTRRTREGERPTFLPVLLLGRTITDLAQSEETVTAHLLREASISPGGSHRRRRTTWHGFGPGKGRAAFSARKHPEEATTGNRTSRAKDVGRKPGFVGTEHLGYNAPMQAPGRTYPGMANGANRLADTCYVPCKTRPGRGRGIFCWQ